MNHECPLLNNRNCTVQKTADLKCGRCRSAIQKYSFQCSAKLFVNFPGCALRNLWDINELNQIDAYIKPQSPYGNLQAWGVCADDCDWRNWGPHVFGSPDDTKKFENLFDDNIGLILIFKNNQIHLLLDSIQSCCEDFGMDIGSLKNFADFKSKRCNILDVHWNLHNSENGMHLDTATFDIVYECANEVNVLEIMLFNYHNGYYRHELTLVWDGYTATDYL